MKHINEGPRDPNIFKAVFTAGIPGSGKTTVIKKLLSGTGMKWVSFDEVYEYLIARGEKHDPAVEKSVSLTDMRMENYINGRLGLIIDKTAWDYEKIKEFKAMLDALGYESFMIYVNTDLDVAKTRVQQRFIKTGRNVTPEYMDKVFDKLRLNIGKYQQDFGENFVIVDNTKTDTDPKEFEQRVKFAQKKINRFLNSPLKNPLARKWIQDAI